MVAQLVQLLGKSWWVLLLRGVIAIIFALVLYTYPNPSITALTYAFGIFCLVDGIVGSIVAITDYKDDEYWWVLLLWSLLGILIGILTFVSPQTTSMGLLIFIAAWSIASGILEIVLAIQYRKEIKGEWIFILLGLLSIVFGCYLMYDPQNGALSVIWMIATFALILGILLIIAGFKVHNAYKKLEKLSPESIRSTVKKEINKAKNS